METRPLCGGGTPSDHLDTMAGVCLPTLLSTGNLPQEDGPQRGNTYSHSSSVAPPTLVLLAAGESGGITPSSSSLPNTPPRSIQSATPLNAVRQSAPCRLENIQSRFSETGVSDKTMALIKAGGVVEPMQHMSLPGRDGSAGASEGRLIPFLLLQQCS